ncbi:MAG: hypothetical protein IJ626_00060 [Muribaculaceae bacterium]|nr:hypothetical protein [Muribaculaceae bacterium]
MAKVANRNIEVQKYVLNYYKWLGVTKCADLKKEDKNWENRNVAVTLRRKKKHQQ